MILSESDFVDRIRSKEWNNWCDVYVIAGVVFVGTSLSADLSVYCARVSRDKQTNALSAPAAKIKHAADGLLPSAETDR